MLTGTQQNVLKLIIYLVLSGILFPVSTYSTTLISRDSLIQIWQDQEIADTSRMEALSLFIVQFHSGKNPDSIQFYGSMLNDLAIQSNNLNYQAEAQNFLGNAAIYVGRYQEAKQWHEKASNIWKELNNLKELVSTYNSLGVINKDLGHFDQAINQLDEAVMISYQLGDSSLAINPLINIASIFETEGDILKSLEYNQQALKICQQFSKELSKAIVHNNLANNYKFLGDISNATFHYLESRAIYESTNNSIGVIGSLNNLALLHIDNQAYDKAKIYLDEALKLTKDLNLIVEQAVTMINIATLYQVKKEFDKALEYFQENLEQVEERELLFIRPYIKLEMGDILIQLNKFDKAEKYITEGFNDSKINGRQEDVYLGYIYLSKLLIAKKKWQKAKVVAEEGFSLIEETPNYSRKAEFADQLVQIYKHFGNAQEALRMYELQVGFRDSIYNDENRRTLINQEYQYSYEKKAYQDSLKNVAQLQVKEANLQRRNLTIWFLVGILLLAVLFGFMLLNRYRIIQNQKKVIHQEKNKAEEANAKLKEIDQSKSRFFTNISHELRTPLTVISGMTDQISGQDRTRVLIRRNANRLLNLINQILDLRKLESGSLKLQMVQDDVISYLKNATESFETIAKDQSISLTFSTNEENLMMDFDPDKLLKIHTNLVSNSLKFTPKNGSITVNAQKDSENQFSLSVEDTGEGIPAEKLPMIFDRFYQVDNTTTYEGEGTGIGLTLTKELVELMNGKIEVSSKEGKGTQFKIVLPITQIAVIQKAPKNITFQPESEPILPLPQIPEEDTYSSNERPGLLIIEDNPDIVEYLLLCLSDQYETFSASDGQKGIEAAFEHVPDLIITDVMMPYKNGYEVCETLKLDERTSHIPIVMLTAKADQPSRIEGFKRGADAYLAKPFDQEELMIRLEKLLEIRKTLRQRYQNGVIPVKTDDPIIQVEDEFLSKAHQLILEHIDETNYRGDSLGEDMGMSRTNFYRKIKALTGQPPSYFIRAVRAEHAKELLQTTDLRIAEIAYMTGFSNPAYFNRIFSNLFELSPGEWREKNARTS